jgi:hypothetical protein
MDKKLLMKVGIGAGVLVLGFLAYKKFVAKPAETKSAEAEEATTDEATETGGTKSSEATAPTTETTPVTPRTKKNITTTAIPAQDLVSSPPPRKKRGITSAEVEKMKAERKRLKGLGARRQAIEQGLRDFAQQNGISYTAFEELRQRNVNTMLANQPATFMDFDANNDALGSLM